MILRLIQYSHQYAQGEKQQVKPTRSAHHGGGLVMGKLIPVWQFHTSVTRHNWKPVDLENIMLTGTLDLV